MRTLDFFGDPEGMTSPAPDPDGAARDDLPRLSVVEDASDVEGYVARMVASAPPMTSSLRARLAALLQE